MFAVEAVEMLFWQGEEETFILFPYPFTGITSHVCIDALPCVFRCFTKIDLSVSLMIFEEKLHTLKREAIVSLDEVPLPCHSD